MFNLLSAFGDGVDILLTFVSLLCVMGLSAYLIFTIKRERVKYTNEASVKKGIMTLSQMEKYVDKTLSSPTKKTSIIIYQIDIRDYDNLFKVLGETQYNNLIKEINLTLGRLLTWGIRVAMLKPDVILMCIRNNTNFDASSLADLIIENLAKKHQLTTTLEIAINVNVAIAAYPEAGSTFNAIVKNLELSMVVSRRKGVDNYAIYTTQIGNTETEEYKFYMEIREAIKDKDFLLYYQPIVDTDKMEICAAESLVRWNHKTKGVLSPNSFLHIMEKTGDINWVGIWCFEQMVKQLNTWAHNFEDRFMLTINLSQRQLLNPSLAEEFRRLLKQHKGIANNIVMEIDDVTLYFNSDVAKINIDKLSQNGFLISADFGSDFTDLGMIEKMPLNMIKIYESYWKKIESSTISANIVKMLVEYSRDKNITLVAQGVETVENLYFLKNIGIHFMQGYVFSPAKNPKDFISEVLLTPWADEINTRIRELRAEAEYNK